MQLQCCRCDIYFDICKCGEKHCMCPECYHSPFGNIIDHKEFTCSRCHELCESTDSQWHPYGYWYHVKTYRNELVCDKCFNIPKRGVCYKCKKIFRSRNKLFEHLKDADHYTSEKKCPKKCFQEKIDTIKSNNMMAYIDGQLKSDKKGCIVSIKMHS